MKNDPLIDIDDLITELLGRVSVDPKGYKGDKLLLNRCLLALQESGMLREDMCPHCQTRLLQESDQ